MCIESGMVNKALYVLSYPLLWENPCANDSKVLKCKKIKQSLIDLI